MSVYLDDMEMTAFLKTSGLTQCSNQELLDVAERFNRLGHAESSCGAWFMRYSIIGFIERNQLDRRRLQGDPVAIAQFLLENPKLNF